jgi:hypothetical protein
VKSRSNDGTIITKDILSKWVANGVVNDLNYVEVAKEYYLNKYYLKNLLVKRANLSTGTRKKRCVVKKSQKTFIRNQKRKAMMVRKLGVED